MSTTQQSATRRVAAAFSTQPFAAYPQVMGHPAVQWVLFIHSTVLAIAGMAFLFAPTSWLETIDCKLSFPTTIGACLSLAPSRSLSAVFGVLGVLALTHAFTTARAGVVGNAAFARGLVGYTAVVGAAFAVLAAIELPRVRAAVLFAPAPGPRAALVSPFAHLLAAAAAEQLAVAGALYAAGAWVGGAPASGAGTLRGLLAQFGLVA